MYPDWVLLILTGVAVIWLLVLSFLIWRQDSFLRGFFPRSGERDIRKKFEEVISVTNKFKLDIGELGKRLSEFEKDAVGHIQKVEVVRFNPYDDTGGDQSFSAVFLDRQGNGLVVSSLHSRSGTRVFAKPVVKGKAGHYQFSKEEEEVVNKAIGK